MTYSLSSQDRDFKNQFESCRFPAADFDHKSHIRLAYVYLAGNTPDESAGQVRKSLNRFIRHAGADPAKYHETLTCAWVYAVNHFMERSSGARCFDDFIEQNPALLDSRIMLSHYSAELLFSATARDRFVEPDREPIPRRHR